MKRTLLILTLAFSIPAVSNSSVIPMPFESMTVSSANSNVFDGFRAARQQTGVALLWSTFEVDITSFEIQHSTDGVTFTTIDQVSPEAGWNRYQHETALPDNNYYRISAILSDGTTEYSDIAVVRRLRTK